MTVKRTRKGTRLDLKMYAYCGSSGGIGLPWVPATRSDGGRGTEALRPMIDGWIEVAKTDERPTSGAVEEGDAQHPK